ASNVPFSPNRSCSMASVPICFREPSLVVNVALIEPPVCHNADGMNPSRRPLCIRGLGLSSMETEVRRLGDCPGWACEKLTQRSCRQSWGEEVALTKFTAEGQQRLTLLGQLDTFRDGSELERIAQANDRARDGGSLWAGSKPVPEGVWELE